MLPQRVQMRDLEQLWRLSHERVRQLRVAGTISPDAEGYYDLAKCLEARPLAVSPAEADMILSTPRVRKPQPNQAGAYSNPDLDCLGDAYPQEMLTLGPPKITATQRMAELRAEEASVRLEKLRRQQAVEEARLVDRMEVYRASASAAAEIATMMRAIEHEVAALFPDHDTRVEVRTKVGNIVDRALYSLSQKFEALAKHNPEEDEDI